MSLKSNGSRLKSGNVQPGPQFARHDAGATLDFRLQPLDRPFIFVNMAMTADGKIATASRAVSSFGSARDHEHLLELRATADAVMAGARTVDLNKVNLGPGGERFRKRRLQRGLAEYNLRIIVSGSGSLDPNAHIFNVSRDGSPVIVLTTERASPTKLRRLRSRADTVKVCGRREIRFRATLRWLKKKCGVNRLLCEGGGELNDALFRADLVDELHLTVCPKIFGGRQSPTIAGGIGFPKLAHATAWKLKSTRRIGDETYLVFRRPISRSVA